MPLTKNVNYLLNSFWSIYIVEGQFPKHLHSSRIVLMVKLLLKLLLMIAKWFLVWLFVILLAVGWLLALVHKHLIRALSWSNEEFDCSIPISLPDEPDRWCSTKVPYHHHRDFDNNYGLWWILQKKYFKQCGWKNRKSILQGLVAQIPNLVGQNPNPIADKYDLIQFWIQLHCMFRLSLRHMECHTFLLHDRIQLFTL